MKTLAVQLLAIVAILIDVASGHGYIKSPRSRNYVAYEDGLWFGGGSTTPKKENCPHCLNLGGTLATCGVIENRNYDYPKNHNGGPLDWNTQSEYVADSVIDIEVVLTAHHKGHFEFKSCPIVPGDVASQECFDSHPLEFVSDELYSAPRDANYPGRAYIAPPSITQSDNSGVQGGMLFHYKFKLPDDVFGNVLIQWHYITGNSCTAEGYGMYPFPSPIWTSSGVSTCSDIPADGNGVPEQFWNCAEIYINGNGGPVPNPPTPTPPTPTVPTPTPPTPTVPTPTSPPSTPCGGGIVGDGICEDSNLCCSQYGWCGSSTAHCSGNPPGTPAPTPVPVPPSPTVVPPPTPIREDDSRLIAYLGNWQSCPTTAEVAAYTHIIIAFAVSYTWNPNKNICSSTCQISMPPICNNAPNPSLVQQWQSAGKKVILSFGGAGMGGSWAGDNNDCWESCYGRESQVTSQLVQIVHDMGLDGVDLDFEYHVTPQAVTFLNQVTTGLRNNLPSGSEITHAPMDSDIIPNQPYYEGVLKVTGHQLDYLMPQYYNGYTRPAIDGVGGTGSGSMAALSHYTSIVDNIFGGDPNRMVFGFCISDCAGTGSNANGSQASTVMTDLAQTYPCNGGAFFWVAEHDTGGLWSSSVGSTINSLASNGCSSTPTTPQPTIPPTPRPTSAPTLTVTTGPTHKTTPSHTSAPTHQPTTSSNPPPSVAPMCCEPNENKLKAYNGCTQYYTCSWGNVLPNLVGPMSNGALFDESIGNWNWPTQFACYVDSCGGSNPPPTSQPTQLPGPPTGSPPTGSEDPCCPSGFTGMKAWNNCTQFYHCVGGAVTGDLIEAPEGTLFDNNIQNINWANQVTCVVDNCGRRLRGGR